MVRCLHGLTSKERLLCWTAAQATR